MTTKTKIILSIACLLFVSMTGFFAIKTYLYAQQPDYKTYKSNIIFQYPKSWAVRTGCDPQKLPTKYPLIGTRTVVRGDFKADHNAKLVLHGNMGATDGCRNGNTTLRVKPPEKCHEIKGKKLSNGLYVTMSMLNNTGLSGAPVDPRRVTNISVINDCGASLFNFAFVKDNGEKITSSDDLLRYQEPGVNADKLLKSEAYKEIVKFAESIKLESQ